MITGDKQLDDAIDAFMQELMVARLSQANPTLGGILGSIKALKKSPAAVTVDEVRKLRADLIAYLESIEKSAAESSEDQQVDDPLTPPQREKIQQRMDACLEYALGRAAGLKNAPTGGLAWLARLRV